MIRRATLLRGHYTFEVIRDAVAISLPLTKARLSFEGRGCAERYSDLARFVRELATRRCDSAG